jgi:hypothetical protein
VKYYVVIWSGGDWRGAEEELQNVCASLVGCNEDWRAE